MATTIHPTDEEHLPNPVSSTEPKSNREKMGEAAGNAQRRIGEHAGNVQKAAQDTAQDMRDGLVKAGEKAREAAEKQPLIAVAGVFAVGVLVGMAVNRSRY